MLSRSIVLAYVADGHRVMFGCFGGLRALVQGVAPHREALALEQLSADLNKVLESVVKIVNFIKTRPLKYRLFQRLFWMNSEPNTIICYFMVIQ